MKKKKNCIALWVIECSEGGKTWPCWAEKGGVGSDKAYGQERVDALNAQVEDGDESVCFLSKYEARLVKRGG